MLNRKTLARLVFAGLMPAIALVFNASLPTSAAELVMFRERACPYCEAWDREIGVIYGETEEGRRAPLRKIELSAPRSTDLTDIAAIVYSPTFVLVENGREQGRITGYPGEDFFWPMLQNLLGRLDQNNREGEKSCGSVAC